MLSSSVKLFLVKIKLLRGVFSSFITYVLLIKFLCFFPAAPSLLRHGPKPVMKLPVSRVELF